MNKSNNDSIRHDMKLIREGFFEHLERKVAEAKELGITALNKQIY